jgi:hypothetical protein
MEWEYVPQDNGMPNAGERPPNDRCGAFGDDGTVRRPFKLDASHQDPRRAEMDFIGERHAGAAPSTIAQVASNPDRIDARIERRPQAAD